MYVNLHRDKHDKKAHLLTNAPFFILLSHIITIVNLGDSNLLLKIDTYLDDRKNGYQNKYY